MSEEIHVEVSKRVFNPVYLPHLHDTTETQIYYGGASSGKSYFLAERVVYDLMEGNRNYLICRKVGKYVMKSVWIEVENVITAWGVEELFEKNKTDRTITCVENGKQAIFTGLDEPQKLKSIRAKNGAITDIWLEEATEMEPNDVKELEKRQRGGDDTPKRVTFSFNPILQSHWIAQRYFSGWTDDQTELKANRLSILKTTYKDNRFLTQQDIDRLESEEDQYYRDVYTLGNWGVLGDVIFTNWITADLLDPASEYYLPDAQRTHRKHGLDFGFSSDPAALPATHYDKKRKRIYIYGELYELGLTNDVLAVQVKQMIGGDRVTCDSSEPKSIQELRMHGVNAHGAKKGKDSVLHGIQWLQQQTIIVDKRCVKSKTELQQYQWKKDKDGNSIRQPVDKNNHIIDGLRYGYEDEMITIGINTKASVSNYITSNQPAERRPGF
jgi:phage terminase large subunit